MCELHNKEARPSSSNEGPKSPPSCAGRRGGMPPGRVAPNGGTRSQGGAVQIGSERADCDTNNAASLKEAHVDHSEGGVCVTSIQGGVERRNSKYFCFNMTSQPACSTRRLDPRRRRAEIRFAAGLTRRDKKWGSMRILGVRALLFKKDD